MHTVNQMKKRFAKVFNPEQSAVLSEIINDAYSELVKSGDFNELKDIVKYLGLKMGELADAQKQTEKELRELVVEHKKTRRRLGGISQDVGYGLEDKAMPYMVDFVKKNYGIEGALVKRKNIVYPNGKFDELNIYVEGTKHGKKAFVIGECKSQPSKKDADKFHKVYERVKTVLDGEIFLFMMGYSFDPSIKNYIMEKYPEIAIIMSYDFELNYKKVSLP